MAELRIAIVASRFNPEITERLVAGAQEALRGQAVTLIHVPGAFEIPLAAKQAAKSGRFDAIVWSTGPRESECDINQPGFVRTLHLFCRRQFGRVACKGDHRE